jgi:hypothetical protein
MILDFLDRDLLSDSYRDPESSCPCSPKPTSQVSHCFRLEECSVLYPLKSAGLTSSKTYPSVEDILSVVAKSN